jgi:hypothetical protein
VRRPAISIGVSYFGNRILRHVAADMDDLARKGFTGVLHTFTENDLAYYREHMAKIVRVSSDAGLEVQIGPWGLGYTFGGEAESLFTSAHPEVWQEMDDGRRVGAGCPNQPAFRAFVRQWADAAIETGADRVFWDEPHWAHPSRFGLEEERFSCFCSACRDGFRARFGEEMPRKWTDEVVAFREASLVEFVRDLVAHVAAQGGRSTVCLLPLTEGSHGLGDWEPIASAPGLDTLATDPYWKFFGHEPAAFVGEFARRTHGLAERHGLTPQIWIQGFKLGPEDADGIAAAVEAARAAGVEDLWTWGYEACGHMTYLGTRDPEKVWAALVEALTGGGGGD